jgi:hypothetical protein
MHPNEIRLVRAPRFLVVEEPNVSTIDSAGMKTLFQKCDYCELLCYALNAGRLHVDAEAPDETKLARSLGRFSLFSNVPLLVPRSHLSENTPLIWCGWFSTRKRVQKYSNRQSEGFEQPRKAEQLTVKGGWKMDAEPCKGSIGFQ